MSIGKASLFKKVTGQSRERAGNARTPGPRSACRAQSGAQSFFETLPLRKLGASALIAAAPLTLTSGAGAEPSPEASSTSQGMLGPTERPPVTAIPSEGTTEAITTPQAPTLFTQANLTPASLMTTQSPSQTQQTLVDSALSQLGVSQDCTALVEKALRALGKDVGDLAPADFFQYGEVVTDPKPGDLIYYDDAGAGVPHIAIKIDDKNAVHGGWTGYTTAIAPIDVGNGPAAYIRVK